MPVDAVVEECGGQPAGTGAAPRGGGDDDLANDDADLDVAGPVYADILDRNEPSA